MYAFYYDNSDEIKPGDTYDGDNLNGCLHLSKSSRHLPREVPLFSQPVKKREREREKKEQIQKKYSRPFSADLLADDERFCPPPPLFFWGGGGVRLNVCV